MTGDFEGLPYVGANIGYEHPLDDNRFLYTHLGATGIPTVLMLPDARIGLGRRF